jgi:hypothetical protein
VAGQPREREISELGDPRFRVSVNLLGAPALSVKEFFKLGAAAEIVLVVRWIGGVHSEMRLSRRRRGQRNATSADVTTAARQHVLIANDDLIAGILNPQWPEDRQ